MTVLIAGAGIAGLTLALTCHQLGIPARVFERSKSIKPLGVGINLQPNCVRELLELGLSGALDAIGLQTREVAYFTKYGKQIWAEPRGLAAGNAWPQYSVHRGQLQNMLYQAVLERLGPKAVVNGTSLQSHECMDNKVIARFQSDEAQYTVAEGSVLIGADGIHSAVRSNFYPDEGPPKWGGAVLWRGTSLAKPFLNKACMAMIGHEFQKFVAYPLNTPDPETGKALINWIAELKFDPDAAWRTEDWNRSGKLDDFLPAFESWEFDWLNVPELIKCADEVLEYPMVDRDPLPRWTFDRATLIGDAAHAMYPIGSNGASQAIIDTRVLGLQLKQLGLNEHALMAYEAVRREATNAIVLANRGNGPDQIMEIVEQRSRGEPAEPGQLISDEELQRHAAHYKSVVGLSIAELNARPSIINPDLAQCSVSQN